MDSFNSFKSYASDKNNWGFILKVVCWLILAIMLFVAEGSLYAIDSTKITDSTIRTKIADAQRAVFGVIVLLVLLVGAKYVLKYDLF